MDTQIPISGTPPARSSRRGVVGIIIVVLVVLGVIYIFKNKGAGLGTPTETGPIKIGALAPLTGDGAAYGIPTQNATMLAVNEINAAGGVNGRQLQVVWEDGKCNGTDATSATQKLLNVDGVKIILGGACSGETLAAAKLTQAARALLLSALSTSPDITMAGDLVFRTYPSDAFQGQIMAAYATKELSAKTAATISENTDYAQALRKVFTGAFTERGGSVVFDETYNTSETDFRTLVVKMKAVHPDVVYVIPQTATSGELILKQMKEAGISAKVLGSDPFLSRDLISKSPGLYENMVMAEVAVDEKSVKAAHYIKSYTDAYGHAPEFTGYLAAAYDSTYLLVDAMKVVGANPEKIAVYFNTKIKDWDGALGKFNFDENGDAVLTLNLRKAVGGKVIDLGPYTP